MHSSYGDNLADAGGHESTLRLAASLLKLRPLRLALSGSPLLFPVVPVSYFPSQRLLRRFSTCAGGFLSTPRHTMSLHFYRSFFPPDYLFSSALHRIGQKEIESFILLIGITYSMPVIQLMHLNPFSRDEFNAM
jgi:hypothetical protein